MFEFKLEEVVFYMGDNKVCSAPVLSRICVDNVHEKVSNDEQAEAFQKFGKSMTRYATIHGTFNGDKVFHTRQDLLDSL